MNRALPLKAATVLAFALSCGGAGKGPPAPSSAPVPDPAPAPEETAVGSPQDRYQRWLAGRPDAGEVLAGPDHGNPTYQLFFVAGATPGQRKHAAAASADAVVVPGDGAGWEAFLQSAPPAVLQDQIGWMNGSWSSHAPSRPASAKVIARDPKNQQYVAEPSVTTTPDGLVFEAFYGEPPSFDPFRLRIAVTPAGTTFKVEPVWRLP